MDLRRAPFLESIFSPSTRAENAVEREDEIQQKDLADRCPEGHGRLGRVEHVISGGGINIVMDLHGGQGIGPMRKMTLLAAATIGTALFAATPSVAQPQLQFGIGPDGRLQFGVRDPEQERRERLRQREAYEQGRRDAAREERRYGTNDDCRNITIVEQDRSDGSVTRRIRRCD